MIMNLQCSKEKMTAAKNKKFNQLVKNQYFRVWLAILGISTIIIGGSYTMVQQPTRLSASR